MASLDEVLAHIAKDAPSNAQSLAAEALEKASSLSTLSERGRVVPELAQPDIREVFVHRYRLMYRVESARVVILAFIHGARDFERWRQEAES